MIAIKMGFSIIMNILIKNFNYCDFLFITTYLSILLTFLIGYTKNKCIYI